MSYTAPSCCPHSFPLPSCSCLRCITPGALHHRRFRRQIHPRRRPCSSLAAAAAAARHHGFGGGGVQRGGVGQPGAGGGGLGGVRPDRAREGAAVPGHRADRVGELHVAGGNRGAGVGADEQVLGGAAGGAVLRRERVHRPDREPVQGAGAQGVPPGGGELGRERAAVLGVAGELRGVHGAAAAARPDHGAGPAVGRAPDARLLHVGREEDLGHVHLLREPAVQGELRDGVHRLREAGGEGAGLPAQDDHLRGERVPAGLGLRAAARDRGQGGRAADVRHGALQRAGGGAGGEPAVRVLRRGDDDDAQEPAGAARGDDLLPEGAEGGEEGAEGGRGVRAGGQDQLRGVPVAAGRAAQPPDRGAGGGAEAGGHAAVQGVREAGEGEREGDRRGADEEGVQDGDGRDGEPPGAVGPAAAGPDGEQGGEGVRAGAHHAEQERGVRRQQCAGPRRRANRSAGDDVAGAEGEGLRDDRGVSGAGGEHHAEGAEGAGQDAEGVQQGRGGERGDRDAEGGRGEVFSVVRHARVRREQPEVREGVEPRSEAQAWLRGGGNVDPGDSSRWCVTWTIWVSIGRSRVCGEGEKGRNERGGGHCGCSGL